MLTQLDEPFFYLLEGDILRRSNNEHDKVEPGREELLIPAEGFPTPPLDPVSIHGPGERLAADRTAKSGNGTLVRQDHEGEPPASQVSPLPENPPEIGLPGEASGSWKLGCWHPSGRKKPAPFMGSGGAVPFAVAFLRRAGQPGWPCGDETRVCVFSLKA